MQRERVHGRRCRRSPTLALLLVLIAALPGVGLASPPQPGHHPVHLQPQELPKLRLTPSVHTVDEVAPALRNATLTAIDDAHFIIARYSDILIAVIVPIGFVATFLGYLLLSPVLFTAGFIIGGGLCFIAVRVGLDETPTSAWVSILAMLIGGGLCGFLAVKMLDVGIFALGAVLGVSIAAALKAIFVGHFFSESPRVGFIASCVVLGGICGLLALAMRRQMLILSTAFAGSFAFSFGIGHFLGHFPTVDDLGQVESGSFNPWTVAYLAITGILGTAGMIVQLRFTQEKPVNRRSDSRRPARVRVGSDSSLSVEDNESERELLSVTERADHTSRAITGHSAGVNHSELHTSPSFIASHGREQYIGNGFERFDHPVVVSQSSSNMSSVKICDGDVDRDLPAGKLSQDAAINENTIPGNICQVEDKRLVEISTESSSSRKY